MDKSRHTKHPPIHSVGGQAWRPSLGYLAIALVLVAGGLAYLLTTSLSTDVATDTATSAPASGVAPAWPIQATVPTSTDGAPKASTNAPKTPETGAVVNGVDPTPDLSNYVARGEKPTMNEVIDRLHQAGIHTGLGAFNPPGTRPPLVGLAVPEGFVLPPGYVRHYQATDDGQRIEPILMFAPDHLFFDANNHPIEVPKDRIVPPELAPAGMPIRRIVVPAPIESWRSAP